VTQDGVFGGKTADAVRAFQTRAALLQDGIVGRATWAALVGQSAPVGAALPDAALACFNAMDSVKWSAAQRWGIVANIKHESDFNPAAVGDGGAAYGLCQWHRDRQATFANKFPGRSIFGSSLQEQCAFIDYELTTTEGKAAAELGQAATAQEAGEIFCRWYERPAAVDAEALARGQTAAYYETLYTPGAGPAPTPPAPIGIAPDRETSDVLAPRTLQDLQLPHSLFPGGNQWQLSQNGVILAGPGGPAPQTDGAARLLSKYGPALFSLLTQVRVPIELVLAMLDLFAAGTGKRFLPGCDTELPERTPELATNGVMQPLLSLARLVLRKPDLTLDDLADPQTALSAGIRIIWLQGAETAFDPPLVAAAYAAGGLFYDTNPGNTWRIIQTRPGIPNLIDSFVQAFNGATAVMANATLPAGLSSLLALQKAL